MFQHMIPRNYMTKHVHINEKMRRIVVDWLFEVSDTLGLKQQTINICIIVLDRYLSLTPNIDLSDLQGVAVMSLYIAGKFEEISIEPIRHFAEICDHLYTVEYLTDLEEIILNKISFKLIYTTLYQSLKYFQNKKSLCATEQHYALFITFHLFLCMDYLILSSYEWADKITSFILLTKNFDELECGVNRDKVYALLYYRLREYAQSNSTYIHRFFSNKYYADITKIRLPKICLRSEINIERIIHTLTYRSIKFNNPLTICPTYTLEQLNNRQNIGPLGKGSYGEVTHVIIDNRQVALKISKIDYEDGHGLTYSMLREINSLMMLRHPNIIKIDGFCYDRRAKHFCIGMELMQYTLHDRVMNYKLDYVTKRKFVIQLLCGLFYMHEHDIMHRDITCKNILVSRDDVIKISDLGSCRYYCIDDDATYTATICSLWFRAFEVLTYTRPYTKKADVWSTACLIGMILQKTYLFSGNSAHHMVQSIYKVLGTPTPTSHCEIYHMLAEPTTDNQLQFALTKFPVYPRTGLIQIERIDCQAAHILYQMLQYDPDQRIDSAQALSLFHDLYEHN